MKPRILLFVPGTDRGGCEEFALALARDSASQYDVHVCMPFRSNTDSLRAEFYLAGCTVAEWRCGTVAGTEWPTFDDQLREAYVQLRDRKFSRVAIAIPDPESASGIVAACGKAETPGAAFFQLFAEDFTQSIDQIELCRYAFERLLVPVSVSAEAVSRIARAYGLVPSDIEVLPNLSAKQCDLEAISTRATHSPYPIILCVGRVVPQKGYDIFLRAAARVCQVKPMARFEWIGNGADEQRFLELSTDLGVSHAVTLRPDWNNRILEELLRCSVFVLPSRWEGTPLILSEAMSCACPIVTTRIGGIMEMIGTDECILVDPESDSSLASGIVALLNDARRCATISKAARVRWEGDALNRRGRAIDIINMRI